VGTIKNCPVTEAERAVFDKTIIGGKCFPENTMVLTWAGYDLRNGHYFLPIERIEVGDGVWSRCEFTGETAYKRVTKVLRSYANVTAIFCEYGQEYYDHFMWGPGRSEPLLSATAEHPFWVEGKGWTKVRDLQPGDEFVTYNGVKAIFRAMDLDYYEETVYNLEVEDFHTYFVHTSGIWVHDAQNPHCV
jgi:hypothetical protein